MAKKFEFAPIPVESGPAGPDSREFEPDPSEMIVEKPKALARMIHFAHPGSSLGECGSTRGWMTPDSLTTTCRKCLDLLTQKGMIPSAQRSIAVRVPVLDDSTIDAIATSITGGATPETAAALYDIPVAALRHWLELGARISESKIKYLTEEEARLVRFTLAIRSALAKLETGLVSRIVSAGQMAKHWQANAWLLERRIPDTYGKRAEVTSIVKGSGASFDPSKLSDEQLRQLDELLNQATGTLDITPPAAVPAVTSQDQE